MVVMAEGGEIKRLLFKEELYNIDLNHYPIAVLSDNLRNVFSAGIKGHTKGAYGHFMWLIGPGQLASMGPKGFQKVLLKDFLKNHRLKLFIFPNWSKEQKQAVLDAIEKELALPWYRRRYDFLSYIGHLTTLRWIQSPWSEVCSDMCRFISINEPDCKLKFPNPEDVNKYLEGIYPRAVVYGRYTPD